MSSFTAITANMCITRCQH